MKGGKLPYGYFREWERTAKRRARRLSLASAAVLTAILFVFTAVATAVGMNLPVVRTPEDYPILAVLVIVSLSLAIGAVYWTKTTWRLGGDTDYKAPRHSRKRTEHIENGGGPGADAGSTRDQSAKQ